MIDLTHFESSNQALEGKGSLVVDHRNKRFFCALSQRAHIEVGNELLEKWNSISSEPYTVMTFKAYDTRGEVVYHTDCVMTLLENHAVICLEAIRDEKQR